MINFTTDPNEWDFDYDEWSTPSSLGDFNGCQRAYAISHFFKHNKQYESVHLKFGNLVGTFCTKLVEHYDKPRAMRFALAYDTAKHHLKAFDSVPGKDWAKAWQCVMRFDKEWAIMHNAGWRYDSSEVRRGIRILEEDTKGEATEDAKLPKLPLATLTGSYDLKVLNVNSGEYKLIDFKTVSSLYFYSYEHHPQLMLYVLMDIAHNPEVRHSLPEYFVFEVGKLDDIMKLHRISPLPSMFTHNLVATLNTHIYSVSHLKKIIAKHGLAECLMHMPVNTSACMKGNVKCFEYGVCYEGVPVNIGHKREVESCEIVDIDFKTISKISAQFGQQSQDIDYYGSLGEVSLDFSMPLDFDLTFLN